MYCSNDWVCMAGPPREFLGPKAKGNLPPSSNSPNNDTQTKSTTVCHKQGISTIVIVKTAFYVFICLDP